MIRPWLAILLLIAGVTASAEPLQRYIMGSYVNVREQPSRNAKVVEHLIVNTPVILLSQLENYCEISWSPDRRGFVACNLIGEKPLKLEDIDTTPVIQVPNPQYKFALQQRYLSQLQDPAHYLKPMQPPPRVTDIAPVISQPNPQYSPLRAFWLEPTIERLFDAGKYFEQTALPSDQVDEEKNFFNGGSGGAPELKRASLPEFEAMKSLLIKGIIAPPSQYVRPAPAQTMLPPTRPSFFKTIESIGRPGDRAETLSAQYQIPFQMTVLGKPHWGGDNNSYPLLVGAWDVGEVETTLTKPIYEIAVDIGGQLSVGETVAPSRNSRGDPSQYCIVGFRPVTTHRFLAGYKEIDPWIFFRLTAPPALAHAKVTIERISSTEADVAGGNPSVSAPSIGKKSKSPLAKNQLEGNETLAQVDLDGDGASDLAVWDDGGSGIDLDYRRQRAIFVNVSGEWFLLDNDEIHACGC